MGIGGQRSVCRGQEPWYLGTPTFPSVTLVESCYAFLRQIQESALIFRGKGSEAPLVLPAPLFSFWNCCGHWVVTPKKGRQTQ